MNNLDLKQYGVQEMDAVELKQNAGGFAFFESSGIFYWVEMWGGVNLANAFKKKEMMA